MVATTKDLEALSRDRTRAHVPGDWTRALGIPLLEERFDRGAPSQAVVNASRQNSFFGRMALPVGHGVTAGARGLLGAQLGADKNELEGFFAHSRLESGDLIRGRARTGRDRGRSSDAA